MFKRIRKALRFLRIAEKYGVDEAQLAEALNMYTVLKLTSVYRSQYKDLKCLLDAIERTV